DEDLAPSKSYKNPKLANPPQPLVGTTFIYLSKNAIKGYLGPERSDLSTLHNSNLYRLAVDPRAIVHLDLSQNHIQDLRFLMHLSSLEALILSHNKLAGLITIDDQWPSLRRLDMSHN